MVLEKTKETRPKTLDALREDARDCTRCDLYKNATQTVFGEGGSEARVLFVGEQPGDKEDVEGRPFVGPAGRLFDGILEEVGIDRKKTYVTNAVKHFKFEPRGRRRLHAKPNATEIEACRWWLTEELKFVTPKVIVALGATAARSVLGHTVTISALRGLPTPFTSETHVWVTVHPSYLLRIPDDAQRRAEYARFVSDLKGAKEWIARGAPR